jgi:hypothetical protein
MSDSALLDRPTTEPPTVGRQLRRALVASAAGVAVLGVVAAAVTWGAAPASERWDRAFGDPSLMLGQGVTLPAQSPTVPILHVVPETLGGPITSSRVGLAFGAPVAPVTDSARIAHAWSDGGAATAPGVIDALIASGTGFYVSASGFVAVPPAGTDASTTIVRLLEGSAGGSPTRATDAGSRAAIVQRIVDQFGWTAGSAHDQLGLTITEKVYDGTTTVSALPRLRGTCDACTSAPSADLFRFDSTGRLVAAMVWPEPVALVREDTGRTAAEAFEAVRHHEDGVILAEDGSRAPVVSARLRGAPLVGSGDITSWWEFLDASGRVVASASTLAPPA